MKKILTILAIMMVTMIARAEEVTLEKTSFSDGTISSSSMSFELDSIVSFTVSSNSSCSLNDGYIDVSYPRTYSSSMQAFLPGTCTMTMSTKGEAKIKSIEITFASEELSPSDLDKNGYESDSSTSGIVIDGTTATYSGETSTLTLAFSTRLSTTAELKITKIKVTYDDGYTHVSTAKEFRKAVDANANIKLTQDVVFSAPSSIDNGYMFETTYSGKITGENTSGEDFALIGDQNPLFYHLSDASISHVIIKNFNVTDKTSILARTSCRTSFDHVTMIGDSIYNNDGDFNDDNCGLVSGYSDTDTFEYCTADSACIIYGVLQNQTGSIVGYATGSTLKYCQSAARFKTLNNNAGGVIGSIYNGSVESCLYTGEMISFCYTGGIVGYAENSTITKCVNTGTIVNYLTSEGHEYAGGIVGYLKGESSSVSYCLNFGTLPDFEYDCGLIKGETEDDAKDGGNHYIYCTYNDSHTDNESEYDDTSIYRFSKMVSGEFTYKAKDADGNSWLYQDIDNTSAVSQYSTRMPVPIPTAGTVYSNILCDGTQSYSNKYQSTEAHTSVFDENNVCTVCGKQFLHISDADGLKNFANIVNQGGYRNAVAYLDNDIDMSSCDFTPIGDFPEIPFQGTFDGQGHRIKNLTVTNTNTNSAKGTGVGLFGCVAGTSTIKNLVIDSSCSFKGSYYGTAGIVGSIARYADNSVDSISFTMQNCGNEATVTGNINAAGLIGGVYNTDTYGDCSITIENCYNTGAITGSKESAAFIGYGNKTIDVKNCWNTGDVTGYDSNHSLIRYKSDATLTSSSVYNLSTVATDESATAVTADQARLGYLCQLLNIWPTAMNVSLSDASYMYYTQDLETESVPRFGSSTTGVTYSRQMTNKWGTIILPFDVTISSSESSYDLYSLTAVSGSTLTLTKMTGKLESGTPAIIRMSEASKNNESGKYELFIEASTHTVSTDINNPDAVDGLTLTGAYTSTDITSEDGYIIANNSFWNIADIKGENKVSCAPFRAWLSGSIASDAKQLTIGLGEDLVSTAVDVLDAETSGMAEYYDLNGHKLSDLKQGVNIMKFKNGATKKVIIK